MRFTELDFSLPLQQTIKSLGYEELINLKALREKIQASVDRTNSQVARFETIKKFVLLPAPLT